MYLSSGGSCSSPAAYPGLNKIPFLEQNSFSSAHAAMASGKDRKTSSRRLRGCLGAAPRSEGGRRTGHQRLGEEAALHKAEFSVAELALQRL